MNNKTESRPVILEISILAVLTLLPMILYWQVLGHGFLIIDDHLYVSQNNHVQQGLSPENVVWAFTTMQGEFWHPLTWISLMLDTMLFGQGSAGYHFSNMILHTLNTLLIWQLFYKLTRNLWQSCLTAVLFSIHPLHIESVAWISARKDVLSMFFGLLSLLFYSRYVKTKSRYQYGFGAFFFTLGLMSKPMLVTLPLIMLLLDFWPLNRIRKPPYARQVCEDLLHLVSEKIPLFIMSCAAGVLAIIAQKSGQGIVSFEHIALMDRLSNAVVSYGAYIQRMIWPVKLAVFYPFPDFIPLWQTGACLATLVVFSLFVIRYCHERPFLLTGWLWYLITLLPVIGLIKIGVFANADRYTYLPLTGLFIMLAWGIPELFSLSKHRRIILTTLVVVTVSALTLTAWSQIGFWKNSRLLFTRALTVTGSNSFVHHALGSALAQEGKLDQAVAHMKKAVDLNPNNYLLQNDLARAMIFTGRYQEAETVLRRTLQEVPGYAKAYFNMGIALLAQDKIKEALLNFIQAIGKNHELMRTKEMNPTDLNSDIPAYEAAIQRDPHNYRARIELSRMYIQNEAYYKALSLFELKQDTNWLRRAAARGYERWSIIGD